MAGTTFTYTANMAEPARAVHAGVNAISFAFNSGAVAFGSACDVVLLGRIPDQATILGGYVAGKHGGATGAHFLLTCVKSTDYTKSGGTVKFDQANGSFTLSATAASIFQIANPVRVSLSADAGTSEAVLYLNVTTGASPTVSVSLHGVIYYVCDGRAASD